MTNNNHPITPPHELVCQWREDWYNAKVKHDELVDYLATQAARWGADQQLEQCEKYWMTHGISPQGVVAMRYALRPEPPSLKKQALKVLEINNDVDSDHYNILRRALESLPD